MPEEELHVLGRRRCLLSVDDALQGHVDELGRLLVRERRRDLRDKDHAELPCTRLRVRLRRTEWESSLADVLGRPRREVSLTCI